MPNTESNRFNQEAIKASLTSFNKSLGNGRRALADAVFMLESVASVRDTSPIVDMILTAKKKGDDNAANAVSFIARTIFPGAKFSTDKNKRPVFKISGIQANGDALAEIVGWVGDDGLASFSLRGSQVREKLAEYRPEPVNAKTDAEKLEARVKSDVKWLEENGIGLEAYIAKLQTLRNA